MHYDPEANLISWEIAQGQISHAREIGNFIIHVSRAEKPILVEILDASKFVGQLNKIKNAKELKNMEKMLPETS